MELEVEEAAESEAAEKKQDEANEEQDQYNNSTNNDDSIGTENKMKESLNTVATKTTIRIDTNLNNIEVRADEKSKEDMTKEVKSKIRDLQLDISTPLNDNGSKYYWDNWTPIVAMAEKKVKELQQVPKETELSKEDDNMVATEDKAEEQEKEVVKDTNSLEHHIAQAKPNQSNQLEQQTKKN